MAENLNQKLYSAAFNDDLKLVKTLLAKGARIDYRDKNGLTILHEASKFGHPGIVKVLLDKGADYSARSISGWTPLHAAAENGRLDVAILLIARGADVNANRWTTLHEASKRGHCDVAKLLISKGAQVNAVNALGETPLHKASWSGMAELLIDRGAKIDTKDNNGWTPLHAAIYYTDIRLKVAKVLLDRGASPNSKDNFGLTPLHFAAMFCVLPDTANLLLESGADVNATSNDASTPLHKARWSEIAKLLIEKGAKIHTRAKNGRNALHEASYRGDSYVAKLIIEKGVAVDVKDDFGRTPLYYAAWSGQLNVVKLLISKGAQVNAEDNTGWTPLHEATVPEITKTLIEKGADIDAKNNSGWTTLHESSKFGYLGVAELLIKAKADLNAKTDGGKSALDIALDESPSYLTEQQKRDKKRIAKLLIDSGGRAFDTLLVTTQTQEGKFKKQTSKANTPQRRDQEAQTDPAPPKMDQSLSILSPEQVDLCHQPSFDENDHSIDSTSLNENRSVRDDGITCKVIIDHRQNRIVPIDTDRFDQLKEQIIDLMVVHIDKSIQLPEIDDIQLNSGKVYVRSANPQSFVWLESYLSDIEGKIWNGAKLVMVDSNLCIKYNWVTGLECDLSRYKYDILIEGSRRNPSDILKLLETQNEISTEGWIVLGSKFENGANVLTISVGRKTFELVNQHSNVLECGLNKVQFKMSDVQIKKLRNLDYFLIAHQFLNKCIKSKYGVSIILSFFVSMASFYMFC